MPVEKFRSIEEMNRAALRPSVTSDFDRFLPHCARFTGVFKFRSIEDARHPEPDRQRP